MKFTFAPDASPLPGLRIQRAIDRGGFGEVYYGLTDAGKEVALKLLQRNAEVELRGVRQCLNLKHPNLLSIFDLRTDAEGNHWVVMEYITGPSLSRELEQHPRGLPPAVVADWLDGMAAGVGYLHEQGLVHRDLKPANVFREGGVVKIGDVGLSKAITPSQRSQQTQSVGTVHYMAPEVSQGRYGRELDIYSLGVMAYEMLTGEVPFRGESVGEILMKHLTSQPDLSRLPVAFRRVVGRALEKDPLRRTASAQELAQGFRQALTGATPAVVGQATLGATRIPDSHFLDEPEGGRRGPVPAGRRGPGNAAPAETWISPNPAQPAGRKADDAGARATMGVPTAETRLQQFWAEMGRNPLFAIAVVVTALTLLPFVPRVLSGMGGVLELMVWGSLGYVAYWLLRKPRTVAPPGPTRRPSPGEPADWREPEAVVAVRERPVGAPARKAAPVVRPVLYTPETPRQLSLTERGLDLCWSLALAPLWAAPWGALMGWEGRSGFSTATRGAEIWSSPGGWQSHLGFGGWGAQFSWISAGFFWLLTTLAAWVLLIFLKAWEGRSLSTWGRRLTLACAGVMVGGVAWILHDWLQLGPLPAARDWVGSLRGVETPHPERFVWAAQFALLFGGVRWWLQADAFRARRFRFFPLLTTSLVGAAAGLLLVDSAPVGAAGEVGVWPGALGAVLGPVLATTVQCSAIFVPKTERAAYLATRRPADPLPHPLAEGVA